MNVFQIDSKGIVGPSHVFQYFLTIHQPSLTVCGDYCKVDRNIVLLFVEDIHHDIQGLVYGLAIDEFNCLGHNAFDEDC